MGVGGRRTRLYLQCAFATEPPGGAGDRAARGDVLGGVGWSLVFCHVRLRNLLGRGRRVRPEEAGVEGADREVAGIPLDLDVRAAGVDARRLDPDVEGEPGDQRGGREHSLGLGCRCGRGQCVCIGGWGQMSTERRGRACAACWTRDAGAGAGAPRPRTLDVARVAARVAEPQGVKLEGGMIFESYGSRLGPARAGGGDDAVYSGRRERGAEGREELGVAGACRAAREAQHGGRGACDPKSFESECDYGTA